MDWILAETGSGSLSSDQTSGGQHVRQLSMMSSHLVLSSTQLPPVYLSCFHSFWDFHNPQISLNTGEVMGWGEGCALLCFQHVRRIFPIPWHSQWRLLILLLPSHSLTRYQPVDVSYVFPIFSHSPGYSSKRVEN